MAGICVRRMGLEEERIGGRLDDGFFVEGSTENWSGESDGFESGLRGWDGYKRPACLG